MELKANKTVTAYWNSGGFYIEDEPHARFSTEANMYRRAHNLGYTHVCTKHGYYRNGEFHVEDIPAHTQRIPKRYRLDFSSGISDEAWA